LPTGISVMIQQFTLFRRGIKPKSVGVVHWLFVGIRRSDDFHVCTTPVFGNEDVCAVAGRFHFSLDDFVALDFVSIHHPCLYIVEA